MFKGLSELIKKLNIKQQINLTSLNAQLRNLQKKMFCPNEPKWQQVFSMKTSKQKDTNT